MAEQVVFDFIGDRFVARAGQYVQDSLGTDDLRSWRDQRRITQVFAYSRYFGEHFIHAIERARFLELVGQVGNHAARHLVYQHTRVHAGICALELPVLLAYFVEVGSQFLNCREVEAGVVWGALQRGHDALCRGMAGAFAERRVAGIQHRGARLHCLEETHGRQTRGGVAVQVDRQTDCGAQRLDQVRGSVRREQAGHVLDADGIAAHGLQFAGQFDELGNAVYRAGGVADAAFGMLAGLFYRLDGDAHVAQVVHRIENAEHVDAVVRSLADKRAHHVIGIMPVAEQVLTAQQHLDAAVR